MRVASFVVVALTLIFGCLLSVTKAEDAICSASQVENIVREVCQTSIFTFWAPSLITKNIAKAIENKCGKADSAKATGSAGATTAAA